MGLFATALRLKNLTSPPNPPAGSTSVYTKSGGGLYLKQPSGSEVLVGQEDVRTYTAPLVGQGAEFREQFGTMPDGPPPLTAQTRQTMTNWAPSNVTPASSAPYVRNGFLSTTVPNSAEGGSYRIAELSGDVISCGMRFALSSFTASGGLLCLSIQNDNIATSPSVPVSPMHFYITPSDYSLDVNDVAGTAVENVANGGVAAMTTDGSTLYTVQIVLDRDRQQCHVIFPSGNILTYTDSRFSLPGRYVYVEPYKTLGSPASKTNGLVREWWADSRDYSIVHFARALSNLKSTSPAFATGWNGLGLINGWSNFYGTHQAAQYRKVGDVVQVRGLVKTGWDTNAFILPAGYRPPADLFFPSVANGSFAQILANSNGYVYLTGSTTWFAINFEFSVSY